MCAFGIDGQYKMSVSIGTYEDFLTDDKFISFTLIENIGLSLPYWELKFDCVYPDLLKYLNEKQPIIIQLGTSLKDLEPLSLVIKKPIIVPQSVDSHSVTLRGFTYMHPYLENEIQGSHKDKTTKELAQRIAKKYGLTFVSNIESSNDKMTYYQAGESDYKFLFTAWLHSYYKDKDIIIPAITSKYTLSYNSLKDLIAKADVQKLLTFTDKKPDKDEILVNANCPSESSTTMSNAFGNYMKERYIYHIDTGMFEQVSIENNTPIISESKTTSVDENISKSSGFYVQSSNVHDKYYRQELINTQKFFSIQSSKQWVSASDTIVKQGYPGELALYMAKKDNGQVNDQISGLYLINKRVISIKERKVHTNLQLSRENMNNSK